VEFYGKGIEEKGIITACDHAEYQLPLGKQVVAVDKNYFRPTEVELLIGDSSKARKKLNWEPACTLPELVKEMVQSDLTLFKQGQLEFSNLEAVGY
jgi:GDPmannose 4,6-dehydratase